MNTKCVPSFSPLEEITDDQMAVEVAYAALDEIMKDEQPEEEGTPMVESKREVEEEAVEKAVENTLSKPISRRSFFRRKQQENT